MRSLRRLLNISYKYRITNVEVGKILTNEIGTYSELLDMVIERKLKFTVISRERTTCQNESARIR